MTQQLANVIDLNTNPLTLTFKELTIIFLL